MTRRGNDLTIIILIDALGYEIVEHFGFARRHLPVRGATETVFGYSSAAIPSLVSGVPPEGHGAWAMYRYDPRRSPFRWLRMLPPLPHALEWRTRVLTRWILEHRQTIRGYYDLYEIPLRVLGSLDVAQRGDPFVPGGMPVATLFDALVASGVSYRIWTYRSDERENFAALQSAIEAGADDVLLLYTADLDSMMHRTGIFDARVGERLAEYESQVEEILNRVSDVGRDARIYLFSDHGMTDVHTVVDVWGEVRRWGYRIGRDLEAFFDSTMARFWCPAALRSELTQRLDATGWGRVVADDDLVRFGCDFGDARYGDVIFAVDPGYLIVPSYMGREPLAAMHGYDPRDRFSNGCFLTNDETGPIPTRILDIKSYLLDRINTETESEVL